MSDSPAAVSLCPAQRVLATPELRLEIFCWLDKPSLAVLLRVSKACTTAAGGLLYSSIDLRTGHKLSRKTERRRALCATVRILDTSPHPTPFVPVWDDEKPVVRFDPSPNSALVRSVRLYCKKYPGLHTIRHQYPAGPHDDAYIIRFDSKTGIITHANIETVLRIDIGRRPFAPPTFPDAPTHAGINITHTIRVRLYHGYYWCVHNGSADHGRIAVHFEEWRRWIFCGQQLDLANATALAQRREDVLAEWCPSTTMLDRRVVAVDTSRLDRETHWRYTSMEATLEFARRRRIDGCAVLNGLYLDPPAMATLDHFKTLVATIDPQIRRINLDTSCFGGIENCQAAVDALDEALPLLTECVLTVRTGALESFGEFEPLLGMRNVRRLQLKGLHRFERRTVAELFFGLGSPRCVFQDTSLDNVKAANKFHNRAAKLKFTVPLPLAPEEDVGE